MFRVFCPWLAGEVGFRGSLASFMAAVAFPVLELLLRGSWYCCSGLALSKQSSANTAAQSSTQSRIFSVVAGWCRVQGGRRSDGHDQQKGKFYLHDRRNQELVSAVWLSFSSSSAGCLPVLALPSLPCILHSLLVSQVVDPM